MKYLFPGLFVIAGGAIYLSPWFVAFAALCLGWMAFDKYASLVSARGTSAQVIQEYESRLKMCEDEIRSLNNRASARMR